MSDPKPAVPISDADIWGMPACEVRECIFAASINLCGKWVCMHHAPAEASYIRKYGKPHCAYDSNSNNCRPDFFQVITEKE